MFAAMQAGVAAEKDLIDLFAADAVLTESFTGAARTHKGKAAVRACFLELWNEPGPEVTLTLDHIDIEDEHVRARWTCTSPAFATPMRGYDVFRIHDGLIRSLEIEIVEMPPTEA